MTKIFGFELSYQIGWLIIAIVFGVVEIATMGLATIWFAVGALAAMIIAMTGLSIMTQIITFLIVSGVTLYFTRPLPQKYLKIGMTKTNVDSVIDALGVVTEKIEEFNTGQAKVLGQIWTAKSIDGEAIDLGQEIKVIKVEGVKILVRPVEKN